MQQFIKIHIAPSGTTETVETIAAAQRRIREIKQGCDGKLPGRVTVDLAAGTYRLEEPWRLSVCDGGTRHCPVTYRAAPGAQVVISGGRTIGGWVPADDSGLWRADVSDVTIERWPISDLYADGQRVPPARMPHTGFYAMAGFTQREDSRSFRFKPGDIRPFRNLSDVHVIFLKSFDQSRLRIASMNERENIVHFTGPVMHDLPDGSPHPRRDEGPHARYFLEHVFEGLNAPNRWYLDRAHAAIFFRPGNPTIDPNKLEIVVPFTSQLLVLEGDVSGERRIEHLHFENLTFEHCGWALPTTGYSGCQADLVEPSAVTFQQAQFCSMRQCRIAHVATWAIALGQGCREVVLDDLEINGAGAGGVKIGEDVSEVLHDNASFHRLIPERSEALHNKQNTIRRCHVHHCGHTFYGSVGIFVGDSSDNTIADNCLHDLPYSAISLGYCWANIPTRTSGNRVDRNEIYRCMNVLQDGAGIYCLGRSYGTIICHNVIYGCRPSHSAGARGIYLDESTTGILVTCNVVYDTGDGAMMLHSCYNNRIENNVFLEGFESQFYFVLGDQPANRGGGNVITRNIFAWTRPDAALYRMYPIPAPEACHVDSNLISAPSSPECAIHYEHFGDPGLDPVQRRPLKEMHFDAHSVFDTFCFDELGDAVQVPSGSPGRTLGFVPFVVNLSGLRAYLASQKVPKDE